MPETPSHDPAGSGSSRAGGSIEARLRAAREKRGLSLTDVQQETRIPADVLQRLEDGRLLGDASFNPVYLKALLKAYAGAVGLPAAEVLEGFDPDADRLVAGPPHAVIAGTTPAPAVEPPPPPPEPSRRPDARRVDVTPRTQVSPPVPTPASSPPPSAPTAAPPSAPPTAPLDAPIAELPVAGEPSPRRKRPAPQDGPPSEVSSPAAPSAATATPATSTPASPVSALGVSRPGSPGGDAARGKHRVISAEAARTPRAFHRSWGLIIGGTIALVGIFALALFLLFRNRRPEPERRPQVAAADTSAPRDTVQTEAVEPPPSAGPTLATPIRITVTAGAGGLQNFRVTAEPAARVGHWVEEGESVTFESETAVVLWGEGAEGLDGDATLELQGLRWTPADGRVLRIDAQNGQRLLDSLSGVGPARPASDG